ncbi:ABC transporter ATP-binding protein [Orrella sp. NBD-18]|uniref:ABC transporter ATP-binding protein n=1 Tax=Sheuella amnicola TaxID=2707330 RepID=A0A6B2QYP5_9BURK|nr:ABC transporter ATP-binding protein [Sheuella amnicola]NDY83093.1 ABC transporter ATP-binding protein [Sheuella amnicola]
MLIEFKNVQVRRDARVVLSGIDLSLTEHRIGIIGPNGSGKSSLIRLINGLLQPETGAVCVAGLDTRRESAEIRRLVGFVFQNPDNQIIFPIVHEDIAFGLKHREPDTRLRAQRVVQCLDRLGIASLHDRVIHGLSGGEKQLVALAAVLATEPELLVFDEPTTQLDLRARNHFERTLAGLNQQAILVSHDLELIRGMQRVLVVLDGRVVFDGEPDAAIEWYCEHCG